jgi:hypothetical protein
MARNGIECDEHGKFEFKDAKWEIEEPSEYRIGDLTVLRPGTWTWFCPVCGKFISRELYRPPSDVPTRAPVEPVEHLGGPGIPGQGVAGQEEAVLAEYGGL